MYSARWIQCEEMTNRMGFFFKHPTTQKPIPSPFINIGINYMNQAVRLWNEIFQIVKENCSTDYGEFLTGLSCHAIADRLTAFGIKTPGGKSKWSQSTVKSILKNEKYNDGYFDYVVPPLEGFWWQDGMDSIDYAHKHEYMESQGYALDITDKRLHYEIYLSDARRVAPEKLKTVIRHPVRKV